MHSAQTLCTLPKRHRSAAPFHERRKWRQPRRVDNIIVACTMYCHQYRIHMMLHQRYYTIYLFGVVWNLLTLHGLVKYANDCCLSVEQLIGKFDRWDVNKLHDTKIDWNFEFPMISTMWYSREIYFKVLSIDIVILSLWRRVHVELFQREVGHKWEENPAEFLLSKVSDRKGLLPV